MTGAYRARPRTVQAIQFDGHNTAVLQEFLGNAGVVLPNPDGTVSVYARGRTGRPLLPLWWVSLDEDRAVTTHSTEAFERFWEPAS